MNQRQEHAQQMHKQQESPCAVCGEVGVTIEWVQYTFTYGTGKSAAELTARVPVHRCDDCDFEYLDEVGHRLRHEAVCGHLGVLPPAEIRRIRKRHDMTRAQFSEVTGLGEASLNRWENGINIQTHANDRYLRLLANPRAMGELKRLVVRAKSTEPESRPAESPFRVIELAEVKRTQEEAQAYRVRPAADVLKAV